MIRVNFQGEQKQSKQADNDSPQSVNSVGSYEEQLEQKLANQLESSQQHYASQDADVDIDDEALLENVIAALKTVYDPEIPVNIYDLGLIYRINIDQGDVEVDMTLTAPGCPVAHTFPGMVERTVELVPGVNIAKVELVWDPPWRQDLISEAARLELGLI